MTTQEQSGKLPTSIQTIASKLTDVGRTRDHNEDSIATYIPQDPDTLRKKGALYLVADGMGGHQAGEVASQRASQVIVQEYYGNPNADIAARLSRALRKANEAVYQMAQQNVQRKGMGTTAVAAVVRGAEVHIANVGDSRAYLLRNGVFQQISKDHSLVQEQIDAGIVTRESARNHPQRNVITRALGHKAVIEVDTFRGQLMPGDALLLCSDGLSGPVQDKEIAAILQQFPPEEAVLRLVKRANDEGGPDNVSVIIVKGQPSNPAQPAVIEVPPGSASGRLAAVDAAAVTTQPPATPDAKPPVAKPPAPPPAEPAKKARSGNWGIILIGIVLVAILVAGGLWLLNRDDQDATVTPTSTPTLTTQAGAATPEATVTLEATSTPAGSGADTTGTSLPPTSTPQPTKAPTATDTPRPLLTIASPLGCEPELPTLVEPAPEASHPSGVQVDFKWRGGKLCEGQQWMVLFDGVPSCPLTTDNHVLCAVPLQPGTVRWRVDVWMSSDSKSALAMQEGWELIVKSPDSIPSGDDSDVCVRPPQPTEDCDGTWSFDEESCTWICNR